MSLGADRIHVRNTSPNHTAVDIRNKPSDGVASTHALFVKQYGTSGQGQALVIESDNTESPAFTITSPSGSEGLRLNGALVISAVDGAPDPSTLPLGSTSAAANTGIQLVGSFDGGEDNSSGTDSTPRIDIYSYQRAATHSFGEIQRMWLMRQDSKAMLAWYGPQLTGTQTHGYDANRDALTTGVSWKPWAWLGAHYEANDHASTHGHISIEVPDTDGALQTRFEITFADRTTGAIGLDIAQIITNDADFAVRQSGGESFRIVAPAGTEKRIDFMGDAFGDSTTRRWKIRSTSTAESGSDAGSDFELVRYNDSGVAQSASLIMKRSNGHVGVGAALSDIDSRLTVRQDGTANAGKFVSTSDGTASIATVVINPSTTAKRALDIRLAADAVSRLRVDMSATGNGGTLVFGDGTTADTNLYRSAANTLKTDDSFIAADIALTGAATSTDIFTAQVTGDTQKRLIINAGGGIDFGGGSGAVDTNLYRDGADRLRTDDRFSAVRALSTDESFAAYVDADAFTRYVVTAAGATSWGSGSGAVDVTLYRSGANELKTDDKFLSSRAASGNTCYGATVDGDTFDRLQILASGQIEWGSGTGARDTNLYRNAASVLKTDDKLIAALGIGVGNSAAATALGTVTKKIEVFDATGASLGFVPVYDAIT